MSVWILRVNFPRCPFICVLKSRSRHATNWGNAVGTANWKRIGMGPKEHRLLPVCLSCSFDLKSNTYLNQAANTTSFKSTIATQLETYPQQLIALLIILTQTFYFWHGGRHDEGQVLPTCHACGSGLPRPIATLSRTASSRAVACPTWAVVLRARQYP